LAGFEVCDLEEEGFEDLELEAADIEGFEAEGVDFEDLEVEAAVVEGFKVIDVGFEDFEVEATVVDGFEAEDVGFEVAVLDDRLRCKRDVASVKRPSGSAIVNSIWSSIKGG
jgi:hypothetical protein